MSIEVTVKQKFLGGKTMPLEVILGDQLHCGNYEYDCLQVDECGETEFIAYHPEHIGRGFSVVWNPNEKKSLALRLPQPSTVQELRDFYAAVKRVADYWGGRLIVDGNPMPTDAFMAGFENMVRFNERLIKQISQQVLDGEYETLMLYSAMWPLVMGKEEAAAFLADSACYSAWLHEKQSQSVRYVSPHFYRDAQGFFAQYIFVGGMNCIFPQKPTVPLGVLDPDSGKPLECSCWRVLLKAEDEKEALGELEYSDFLHRIPKNKIERYDGGHVYIYEMSKAEIEELLGRSGT
ncbi:MAG: DUF4299 family protein [Clostridiales bacterium]|nr:DUF4299 family protein [Clostridiales bacterium]